MNRSLLKSRTPLKRRTPLKNGASVLARGAPMKRTRMKQKPPRRLSAPGAAEGRAYMDWVKTRLCSARFLSACQGPIDPHHAGRRPGIGMKAPDDSCIPMCRRHHQAVERDQDPFKGWTKERRLAWYDQKIAFTRQAFQDEHVEAGLPAPGGPL